MSSSDRLNPQQLRLFIPAGELRDPSQHVVHGNETQIERFVSGGGVEETWERKLEESKEPEGTVSAGGVQHGGGVHQSIKESGVHTPVRLVPRLDVQEQEAEGIISMPETNYQSLIRDGMHRIAAAADIDPKTEVPVQWDRNVHWEHDRTGRPDDPGFNPSGVQQEELTPWDDPSFQWESDEYGDLQRFDRSRDQETGQVGDWYHVEHMGEKRGFEPTGQTISEGMLEKLNRPHE